MSDQLAFTYDNLQAGPAWIWQQLLDLRDAGLVKLEALRNGGVKNPLDAEVVFSVVARTTTRPPILESSPTRTNWRTCSAWATPASNACQRPLPEAAAVDVDVADTREKYKRCARSWKRRPDVGSDADYPDLCPRRGRHEETQEVRQDKTTALTTEDTEITEGEEFAV